MKQLKRFSATILVAVMVVLTFHVPVSAATSDPYLITANDTPYTQIVDRGSSTILCVSPSADYMVQSGFDTEEDAENVNWSLVEGSTRGISLSEPFADEMENGKYVSCVEVMVSNNATPGCASIMASTGEYSYVNMTVIVNKENLTGFLTNYRIYTDGNMEQAPVKSGTYLYVSPNIFDGNTQYANVADLTKKLENQQIVSETYISADSSYTLNSYYLSSMTIDGVKYESRSDENYNYYGWQYRVYDANGNIIPLSEYVGIDDFELTVGQTVVWIYGAYGSVTFANTLPALQ